MIISTKDKETVVVLLVNKIHFSCYIYENILIRGYETSVEICNTDVRGTPARPHDNFRFCRSSFLMCSLHTCALLRQFFDKTYSKKVR